MAYYTFNNNFLTYFNFNNILMKHDDYLFPHMIGIINSYDIYIFLNFHKKEKIKNAGSNV